MVAGIGGGVVYTAEFALNSHIEVLKHASAGQVHVAEAAIFGVSAALEIGGSAFNELVKAAIASGDIVTQAMGAIIGKFMDFREEFVDILKNPEKLLEPKFALRILKKFPVIGDIITIGESGTRILSRVVNGEQETCYRSGMELRKFKHNAKECSSPGNLINSSCVLPCSPGKSPAALICLTTCKDKFPVPCGMMCTATPELCKHASLIAQVADVVNAGLTVAHAAGDIASGNFLGAIAKSFSLIDEFAHPICA